MRSLDDDDEVVSSDLKKGGISSQPSWMRALKESCVEWLEVLPKVRPFFHPSYLC
jgi:dynein heavy chain 1